MNTKDRAFIDAFEACTLPDNGFHHRDHIRLAWLYLQQYSVPETLTRLAEGLKRFAASEGKPMLYHETITWAYTLLINERMERTGRSQSWETFMAANPDLFGPFRAVLSTYYEEQTLSSELARNVFVLPDRKQRTPERQIPEDGSLDLIGSA